MYRPETQARLAAEMHVGEPHCQGESFMSQGSNLKQTVQTQMMAAMKAGDKARTSVLRMVLSAIKAQEADHPEADPQHAVAAYAKQLKKAQADMEKLGQAAQVEALKGELAIVDEFLPKQLDDAALAEIVNKTIATLGPVTKKDMGRVMGAVMKAVAGQADGNKIKALVDAKLV